MDWDIDIFSFCVKVTPLSDQQLSDAADEIHEHTGIRHLLLHLKYRISSCGPVSSSHPRQDQTFSAIRRTTSPPYTKTILSFRHEIFSGSRLSDRRCIRLFSLPMSLCACRCGSVTGVPDGGSRWARSSCRPGSPCHQHWPRSRECIPVTRHHRQPLRHRTSAWQQRDRRQRQQPSLPSRVRQIPLTVVWVSDDTNTTTTILFPLPLRIRKRKKREKMRDD
jgi:hypothetical protein